MALAMSRLRAPEVVVWLFEIHWLVELTPLVNVK